MGWQDINARFAAQIPKGERLSARRLHKGERGIWQRRFWKHVIRDEGDYQRHVNYIHYNPVKNGHVAAFTATWSAAFIILYGRQMIAFEVWRWNKAKGGRRSAFPPYVVFT
jgi:hypothetical protein